MKLKMNNFKIVTPVFLIIFKFSNIKFGTRHKNNVLIKYLKVNFYIWLQLWYQNRLKRIIYNFFSFYFSKFLIVSAPFFVGFFSIAVRQWPKKLSNIDEQSHNKIKKQINKRKIKIVNVSKFNERMYVACMKLRDKSIKYTWKWCERLFYFTTSHNYM